jgi:hypothetical protein
VPSTIGHGVCHSDDHILEAGAKTLAASVSVALLLIDRATLFEANSVVFSVVGYINCYGLVVNLGVMLAQRSNMLFHGSRMRCYLGNVLVTDEAEVESVARADAS